MSVIGLAYDMYSHDFRVIHPEDFGHPPLMYLPFALLWKIFGISNVISHLYVLILGLVGLYFAYKIGELLFNRIVGIGAVILLAFNQLFFAELGIVNDSIPLFTLGVITVYCFLKDKTVLYLLFATLLVLTKETATLVILALFIYYLTKRLIIEQKITIKDLTKSLMILLPIASFLAFFVYHQYTLGWALRTDLVKHSYNFFGQFVSNLMKWFVYDASIVSVNKYNFIITGFIIASIIRFKKLKYKQEYFLFFLIILLHFALFSYTDDLPRYFTPILPFYYLLGAQSIYQFFGGKKRHKAYFVIIALIVVLFISNFTGTRSGLQGFLLESNMEYRDSLLTHKDASRYIETNYPHATVITDWPMYYELTQPYQGYVSKEIKATRDINTRGGDVIAYYSPESYVNPWFFNLQQIRNATFIKRFEKNNKYSEIYLLNG